MTRILRSPPAALVIWALVGIIAFVVSWYSNPTLSIFFLFVYPAWLGLGILWLGLGLPTVRLSVRTTFLLVIAVAWIPLVMLHAANERTSADMAANLLLENLVSAQRLEPSFMVGDATSWDSFVVDCQRAEREGVDHGPGHDYFVKCPNGARYMVGLSRSRPRTWMIAVLPIEPRPN